MKFCHYRPVSFVFVFVLIASIAGCDKKQEPAAVDPTADNKITEVVTETPALPIETDPAIDAIRRMYIAMANNDSDGILKVVKPTNDMEILWTQKVDPARIADIIEGYHKMPIRELSLGETVTLPDGKSGVVGKNKVSDTLRSFMVRLGTKIEIPFTVELIDGQWKVIADQKIQLLKTYNQRRLEKLKSMQESSNTDNSAAPTN